MDHDPRAYLWDAREGADATISFVDGRSSWMSTSPIACCGAAAEWQSEIIGETLRKLQKEAPHPNFPSCRRRSHFVTFSFTPTPQSTIERCGARSTKVCRRCAFA